MSNQSKIVNYIKSYKFHYHCLGVSGYTLLQKMLNKHLLKAASALLNDTCGTGHRSGGDMMT